jgi:hypothetical protein
MRATSKRMNREEWRVSSDDDESERKTGNDDVEEVEKRGKRGRRKGQMVMFMGDGKFYSFFFWR